jgi:hypothetical protein
MATSTLTLCPVSRVSIASDASEPPEQTSHVVRRWANEERDKLGNVLGRSKAAQGIPGLQLL